MKPRVRRFAGEADMTLAALDTVSRIVGRAVAERGRCLIALSGGSTPLPLYAAMAARGLGAPWEAVHFFFGDERLVPVGDRRSTFGVVSPLLFTRAPIPVDNIHPMPVEIRPAERAAAVYEEELLEIFGLAAGEVPRFDLMLLGLGPDGHMASLFPGSPALDLTDRLVAAVPPPITVEPRVARLTMTVPVINAAREVLFLVASRGKEQALTAVLTGPPDRSLPASLAAPQHGAGWLILET
jgi:6-phosphogluconolactonase